MTLTNILAAPSSASAIVQGPPPLPSGTPRGTWDRNCPTVPATGAQYNTSCFVVLPVPAFFDGRSQRHPVCVPGLPPWTGEQTLSSRERCWILAPVVRSVPFCGFGSPGQLAVRAQLREAILVTRAGAQPPAGEECEACRDASGSLPFAVCVSGGIGQKCNNCLFRGHRDCSFQ